MVQKPSTTKTRHALRFLGIFAGLVLLYYVALSTDTGNEVLYRHLRWNAEVTSALLGVFGEATQVSETTIRAADVSVSVRRGCESLESAWLLCCVILAVPRVTLWRRVAGMIGGALLLLALNLARITSLFYARRHSAEWFDRLHLQFWPVLFVLGVVGLAMLWASWAQRAKEGNA